MAIVKPATREMMPEIYELLRDFNNPRMSQKDWQNLIFDCGWKADNEHGGFVLVDPKANNKIVGFIGTIFATRFIHGRNRQFCNLSSWIVKDSYRFGAIQLVQKALRLKTHTLTCLTLMGATLKIFKRFKFDVLEDSWYILTPVSSPETTVALPWFWCTSEKERIGERVEGQDEIIFRDHRDSKCKHLLLFNDNEYCYIISSIWRIRNIRCSLIHYVSHPEVFFAHQAKAKLGLLKNNHTLFTLIDSRMVGNTHLRFAVERKLSFPRLYRPAEDDLRPEMVDMLYSELMWLMF
jgi:hypothetical protein